uniref:Uncharacterized protein n=1 Tax=virus sp. ctkyY8 TaxID=2827995 RepID=A0A8S5RDW2_9VIRU|nr:MAG TPA: hypothetical protein [virus sp. ctkyY8]
MEVFIVQNEHEYLNGQKNFYQNNFKIMFIANI